MLDAPYMLYSLVLSLMNVASEDMHEYYANFFLTFSAVHTQTCEFVFFTLESELMHISG